MKKYSIFLLIGLIISSCVSQPGGDAASEPGISTETAENPVEETRSLRGTSPANGELIDFLGEELLDFIDRSETVHSYRVVSKQTDSAEQALYNYPIEAEGPVLSGLQIEELKEILLNPGTYDFERAKRVFLFPSYAFLLTDGDEELLLLLDYSRNELLFVHNDQEYKEDFDKAREAMRSLTDALFPETEVAQ